MSPERFGASPDERAQLLVTIPGVAELLGLTIASNIGDISRSPAARKLVGYTARRRTERQVSDGAAETPCRGRSQRAAKSFPAEFASKVRPPGRAYHLLSCEGAQPLRLFAS